MEIDKNIIEALNDWLKRIFGGPVSVISSTTEDTLNYWRYKNRIRILKKAKKLCEENNIKPKAILPGTFLELLEDAGNIDDEVLSDKYAALIKASFDEETVEHIHPAFPEIIKQLSYIETMYIDAIFQAYVHWNGWHESLAEYEGYYVGSSELKGMLWNRRPPKRHLLVSEHSAYWEDPDYWRDHQRLEDKSIAAINNLFRLGIIELKPEHYVKVGGKPPTIMAMQPSAYVNDGGYYEYHSMIFGFTQLGLSFAICCNESINKPNKANSRAQRSPSRWESQ